MFDPSSIVVGLEIGTSKTCAVVGDVKADGCFRVLGVGQAESTGVRKGEIINQLEVPDLVHKALREAEAMSKVEIRSVWLGITGAHVQAIHNRGVHLIASDDREIAEEDVQDALGIAKTLNLPAHSTPLHMIRQHFIVDGQSGIENPVGMVGHRVEADVLVIHGNFNRVQNAIRAVKSLQIDVDDVCFNGLASSLAVLTPEQKEIGTLVLDLGGGATEYCFTSGGAVRHAGVLTVGGDHVSQDLAIGLKLPLGLADNLKTEYGSALVEDALSGAVIQLPSATGNSKTVNLEHLRRIVAARLEETLEVIAQKVSEAGLGGRLHGGVVLTGGASNLPGLGRLASRIFQVPAEIGRIHCVSGMTTALDQPEFATAIGLAKFGSFRVQSQLSKGNRFNVRRAFRDLFGT